ncbi:MAG: RNA polymerase sigma factor [Alphaproteobacteria bacterium]
MISDDQTRQTVGEGLKPLLPQLWRFALSLTGDPSQADDLMQATCVRALERAHQFEPGTRLHSWAYSIMVSIWRNQIRAERLRRPSGDMDEAALRGNDTRGAVESSILAGQVLTALSDLPDAIRVTFTLVYIEGLTYREAAETLEIPLGTVMSRLASARKTLTRHLGETSERKEVSQ